VVSFDRGRGRVSPAHSGLRTHPCTAASGDFGSSVEREAHGQLLWQAVDAWAARVDVDLVAAALISSRSPQGPDLARCVHHVVADRALVAELNDGAARPRSGRLAWALCPGRHRPGCRPRSPNGPMVRIVLGGSRGRPWVRPLGRQQRLNGRPHLIRDEPHMAQGVHQPATAGLPSSQGKLLRPGGGQPRARVQADGVWACLPATTGPIAAVPARGCLTG
jgi:hypothetical protein